MTLTRARKILKTHGVLDENTTWGDYLEAVILGTEAIERIQVGRNNPGTHWNDPLPGETKD